MFTLDSIPRPLRRFVAEGLGRLIYYLAGLAEDVRRGLIEAVSRTVSESVAGVMGSVIRPRFEIAPGSTPKTDCEPLSETNSAHSEPTQDEVFEQTRDWSEGGYQEPRSQEFVRLNAISTPSDSPIRLALATGLGSVALLLRSFGMNPLALAASVLAGAILIVPG